MAPEIKHEVVVVGAGISGLSAAYHLSKGGAQDIALIAPVEPGSSHFAAGGVAAGLNDNFTRIHHAYGQERAQRLWRFGHASFQALCHFLADREIPHEKGERLRLVTAQDELTEVEKAVSLLQEAGFAVSLQPASHDLSEKVLGIQHEGNTAAHVEACDLLSALEGSIVANRYATTVTDLSVGSNVRLTTTSGTKILCEFVVLANHLGVRKLLPEIADAFIAVADQWSPLSLTQSFALYAPGTMWSTRHGYEWGTIASSKLMKGGGGRFLRPMAGIDASHPVASEKVRLHLAKQVQDVFAAPWTSSNEIYPSLDCRPCDELPIIGPMIGEPRVLVMGGYMGQGLSLGFMAGKCLAQLILHGQSDDLPRTLWPERLRTLEQT